MESEFVNKCYMCGTKYVVGTEISITDYYRIVDKTKRFRLCTNCGKKILDIINDNSDERDE